MSREPVPYIAVSFVISVVAGGLYGAAVIGVPALYGLMIVAGVISLVGYVRWDLRRCLT